MVALNPDFLTPHFLRTPQTAPPSGGARLPATTAHTQALPLPAPTPAGLNPEELHGPPWWPWVLRPPLGAQGRERERGLSEERPPPFSAAGSMVCSHLPRRRFQGLAGKGPCKQAAPRPRLSHPRGPVGIYALLVFILMVLI